MRLVGRSLQATLGIGILTLSSVSSAQGDPAAPDQAPAVAPEPQPAPPPPAPPPPQPAPAPIVVQTPPPDARAGGSDHDSVVGSFGIGYMGRRSILIPGNIDPEDPTPSLNVAELQAPVVGVRYWATEQVGIDAGLGFWTSGGSTKTNIGGTSNEQDDQGFTAFIFHAGVPISLASAGHFSFQVVPEANVGFGSSKIDGGDADDVKLKGFHFDLGARAGAEIHFGFIKLPQLALQANIGARFSYDKIKYEFGDDSVERSVRSFGTTVGDNPWNIFTSNVAALYYF